MFAGKRIIALSSLLLLFAVTASCQVPKSDNLPRPVGFVNDFEKIYTSAEKASLDSAITAFEKKTTVQIAIITVDTFMTSRKDFDDYILRLANKWGVGQKSANNGIVIGISKGLRKIRIENGAGVVKSLPDAETKRIIDNEFIPYFKQGKYFQGTISGLKAIIKKFE